MSARPWRVRSRISAMMSAGLNRLAEADFVCDQKPRGHPMRDGKRGFAVGMTCSEMRARSGVRSDGHDGVASVRSPRTRWRHRPGRTRRGEPSEASFSTVSNGRRNDAPASRFDRSRPRTSRTGRIEARCLTRDHPALVADANSLAGRECRWRHAASRCRDRSLPGNGRNTSVALESVEKLRWLFGCEYGERAERARDESP